MARQVRVEIIGDTRRLRQGFRDAERSSVRFGASIGRLSGVGIRAFGGLGVAMGGLVVAGATLGIKTAANLEQAQIAFTQLLGSGRKAQVFLKQLSSFAARTPFELPGLIDAARGLVGAGTAAKNVIPILTALGDASGALGLDQERFGRVMIAVTQIMNKGKLQAEELMQITEAGIPVWPLLANAMHKPVPELQDMMKHGELLAKDVLPKLFDQMHKDYGGSMAKQSQTLSGLWSTFMDTLRIGLANAIQPLVPAMKTAVPAAAQALGGALKGVSDFISGTLIPAAQTAKRWWDNNKTAIGELGKAFVNTLKPNADAAKTSLDKLSLSGKTLSERLTGVAIFAANLVKWWIETRIQTTRLMAATYSFITALGHAANAIGLVTGAGRHAGDSLIRFGEQGRRVADQDLAQLEQAAKDTQAAIDRMHGKTIVIRTVMVQELLTTAPAKVRQHGGPVVPREVYIVGEAGPELFVPRISGTVIPNQRIRPPAAAATATAAVGGDNDALADAFVRALNRYGLVVSVDDVHTKLLGKKNRQGGIALGLS